MYAVFQLSGLQFSGEEGDTLHVPLQHVAAGQKIDIKEVLMVKDGDKSAIGRPFVAEASVEAEVVGDGKAEKIEVVKYKKRTKYRRHTGHRQDFTEIRISRISAPLS